MNRTRLASLAPLLPLVLLASCRSTVQAYGGGALSADRTATIRGSTFNDAIIHSMAGGRYRAWVEFVGATGFELDLETKIEVPSGEVVLQCLVGGYPDGALDPVRSLVSVTFLASPGERYNVVPVPSEHQWPFAVHVETAPTMAGVRVIASSEPEFEDLELPAPPAFAQAWDPVKWRKYDDGQQVTYAPSADAEEQLLVRRMKLNASDDVAGRRASAMTTAQAAMGANAESHVLTERAYIASGMTENGTRMVAAWWYDAPFESTSLHTVPDGAASQDRVEETLAWLNALASGTQGR